jgi:hypothetical protein
MDIGQYYMDSKNHRVVKIVKLRNSLIEVIVVHDPTKKWKKDTTCFCYSGIFNKFYKHVPGYNSPLWRILHG